MENIMNLKSTIILLIVALSCTMAFSQDLTLTASVSAQTDKQNADYKHFIGSSLFLLGNIDSGDPVCYGQLNYGYRLTPKSNLLVEACTWTYYEPLGTYGNSEEMYPGKVRAIGVGLGCQQFLWKKIYTEAVVTPFLQQFYDSDDHKTQKGFQLYVQSILGYQFEFCKKRLFVEPAACLTFWPVNTNFPESFKEVEDGKPGYKFEPRANFGYRF
jgi:hypothetical protein